MSMKIFQKYLQNLFMQDFMVTNTMRLKHFEKLI